MNILVHILAENSELGASLSTPNATTSSLVQSLMTAEIIPPKHPQSRLLRSMKIGSRVPSVDISIWRKRWAETTSHQNIMDVSEADAIRWTAVAEGKESAFFLPDDHRNKGGDIQLFSSIGGHPGRLRIIGDLWEQERMTSISDIVFESSMLCNDSPCDPGKTGDCGGCCKLCVCQPLVDERKPVFRCHCPKHH